MELKNFLDNQLIKKIDENWGNEVEISNEEFSNLSLLDWRNLQEFLKIKSGDFTRCETWDEYTSLLKMSDTPYLDTTESIGSALEQFQKTLNPNKDSNTLMAVIGTKAKLPLLRGTSGYFFDSESIENIENELSTLVDVLKIGKKDNLIGKSFINHIDSIKLLSDFGKSFLVLYLGDTKEEKALLLDWAPKKGVIKSNMTACVIAAIASEEIELDTDAVLNPRFIPLLVGSGPSQPWWLEMQLWNSAIEMWKENIGFDLDDMDLTILGQYLANAIDPKKNKHPQAHHEFCQDIDMFQILIKDLSE